MRFTPSCETRGLEGKRRDCFQFRIFCLVTCRCNRVVEKEMPTFRVKREQQPTELLTNGGNLQMISARRYNVTGKSENHP
jgi:hypothetical protein